MDRQSNGSFIVKDKIIDTYRCASLVSNNKQENIENNNNISEVKKVDKELKSLKNIDEKMLSIDEYLNDIEK